MKLLQDKDSGKLYISNNGEELRFLPTMGEIKSKFSSPEEMFSSGRVQMRTKDFENADGTTTVSKFWIITSEKEEVTGW